MANTPPSDCSGREWTRADAESGHPEAQFGLGLFYAATPAPQDYAQALEWYQRAADQNHHLAQFNLGQMYAQGQGTPQSDSLALMWIRRAANGGDAGAQYNLADRCARSSRHASEADAVEARIESYKWYSLAAEQGYRDAALQCDSAAMRMSRDEVVEARARIVAVQGN